MSFLDHINPERKYNEGYQKGVSDGRNQNFDIFMPSRSVIQTETVAMQRLAVGETFNNNTPISHIKRVLARELSKNLEDLIFNILNIDDEMGADSMSKRYTAQIEVGLRALKNGEL